MTGCSLCAPSRTRVLAESVHWQVRLNLNQNLLGKLIVVLRRHAEQVVELTPDEWADLYGLVRHLTERLHAAFAPDHFSYAFLQNQDRRVDLLGPSGQPAARARRLIQQDHHARDGP